MSCVVERFIENYNNLLKIGFIKRGYVVDHSLASKHSFHSILQYVLIKAGIECEYVSIPECKARLSKPIDKLLVDSRFVQRRSRYQRSIKVDVAFFEDQVLAGVGEIYTLDEIHGCLSSRELSGPWITPYHRLHSLLENLKLRFLVVVNVSPQHTPKLPYWRDVRTRTYTEWRERWRTMINDLKKRNLCLETYHIEVHEGPIRV